MAGAGARADGEEEKPVMSRKEKRKEKRKMKRKQARRETAEKERAEEEKRLNDPEEQRRWKEMEEEEKERMERERKEYEEREKRWVEMMERKRKEEEEEEETRKVLEEKEEETNILLQNEKENKHSEDENWEYVEEGPAEIIWQGNEIIVRKKKVRVPKKNAEQKSSKEDADRPTSNPLPPQSEAFSKYQNASIVSAQQMLESVAQQVPNFGTEQDKAHCPFHLKTGACRFGQRCSRVHFYPDKACTLLIKNMYNGPGLAWEQDEGLEYTEDEVESCYEEFYEDVHTEFLKYGELVNFKVCKNGTPHLRGNVYVHYKSLDSATLAYHSINNRYFAGKQVKCEFVNVTRWKVAICGEFMKSRLKTCSRGSTCNFIHCFHNPGGDYEWADWDRPPPRYWMEKMAALFGYSDGSLYEKKTEQEKLQKVRRPCKMLTADRDRHHCTHRSGSRDMDHATHSSDESSDESCDVEDYVPEGTRWRSHVKDDEFDSDGVQSGRERERERYRHHYHGRKMSKHRTKVSERSPDYGENNNRSNEIDPNELSDEGRKRSKRFDFTKGSRHRAKKAFLNDNRHSKDESHLADGLMLDGDMSRNKRYNSSGKSSRHQSQVGSADDLGDSGSPDIGSSREGLPRDREGYHRRLSKIPGNLKNGLEFPDNHLDNSSRTRGTDSSKDWLDRDVGRHLGSGRKHSRYSETEFSDDGGKSVKRLKDNSFAGESDMKKSDPQRNMTGGRSTRRGYSRRENDDVNSPVGSPEPDGNYVYGSVKHYGGRRESYDPDSRYDFSEEVDGLDRWEPESSEGDQNTGSTYASVDSFESGSQCDRKSESHDSTDYFCNGKMETEGDDQDKDGGMSISRDKTSAELFNESRPCVSSLSRDKRHPKRSKEGGDPSTKNPAKKKTKNTHHVKQRSHSHKRSDKE